MPEREEFLTGETVGDRAVQLIRRLRDFAKLNHFQCTENLEQTLKIAEESNRKIKAEIALLSIVKEEVKNGCKD